MRLARNTDPDTSEEAAEALEGSDREATLLERVSQMLLEAPIGLTSFQMEAMSGVPHETLSPRYATLRYKGVIVDSGKRLRNPATGRNQIVWRHYMCDPEKDRVLTP